MVWFGRVCVKPENELNEVLVQTSEFVRLSYYGIMTPNTELS
jgi:hypothetical protein